MKTITAPYGYQELRTIHHRYMMLGLLAATVLQLVIISSYYFSEWLNSKVPAEENVITIKDWTKLILPPSIIADPLPPAVIDATIPVKVKEGIPVPIPDVIADPEQTIETQINLSRKTDPLAVELQNGHTTIQIDEPLIDPDPLPEKYEHVEIEPLVISNPSPEYPELARRAGIEGNVWLKVLVTPEGKVKKAIVLKTDVDLLVQAALDAAMKWTFTPAVMNGKPVKVWVAIPFRFRLAR